MAARTRGRFSLASKEKSKDLGPLGGELKKPLAIIGWREWVALPRLGIDNIKAKVDTGARSSALHAVDIHVSRSFGRSKVHFVVHPIQDDAKTTVSCEAPLHDERWIKSSNGKRELRPVIRATVQVGEEAWEIDLTLTSRDMMGFRMLLGREAVRKRFVVNPGRSFLVGPKPVIARKKKKK